MNFLYYHFLAFSSLFVISNTYSQHKLHIGLECNIAHTSSVLEDAEDLLKNQQIKNWQPGLILSYELSRKLILLSGLIYQEYSSNSSFTPLDVESLFQSPHRGNAYIFIPMKI